MARLVLVTVLVVVVTVAPVNFAMPIAVDPIAMIPGIRPVIAFDHATRQSRQGQQRNARGRNRFPVQSLHEAPPMVTPQCRERVPGLSS